MHEAQAIRAMESRPAEWEIVRLAGLLLPQLMRLRKRYGIDTLEVFGSYARNEQGPGSDLDILVSFARTPTFVDLADLEDELADIVGVKVDLVLRSALRPGIARNIQRDLVQL